MEEITLEKAKYIIVYFGQFLTETEGKALRHHHSMLKTKDVNNENLINMYYRTGWLSHDPEVLNYLKDGEQQFMINCATRILHEHTDEVFLNLCPNCGKLARTPHARQCRFCGFDWH